MAAARGESIEELVERSMPVVLARDGYSIYLRHPETHELQLVGFETQKTEAERKRLILTRILCGVIEAAMREYVR